MEATLNITERVELRVLRKLALDQQQELEKLRRRETPRAKRARTLSPVRSSLALEIAYRRKLEALTRQLHDSVIYWLQAAYKQNEPRVAKLAEDATPSIQLRKAIRALSRRWQKQFHEASKELAVWFGTQSYKRSTVVLQNILRRGGWSVNLQLTKAQRDILAATISQNVSLIRSIPSKYFVEIEGMVMRSVMAGRDLKQLTRDLQKAYKVTQRRARLIAHDQNNKASAAMTRARNLELGIKRAIWVHSHAGKQPRPTHLKNDGKTYDVAKGWYDPHEKKWIQPGELINCRCFSRPVVPGFT